MADQRVELNYAPPDQIDGCRKILALGNPRVDEGQLFEIELVERQCSLLRGGYSEQKQPSSEASHGNSVCNGWNHTRRFYDDVGAAAMRGLPDAADAVFPGRQSDVCP